MSINKKLHLLSFSMLVLSMVFSGQASANVLSIEMSPKLDIARFAPYKIKTDISGLPTSASVEISSINGDNPGGPWNYYADGAPDSQTRTKTMSYDAGEGKWISQNIYPDDIYPEIFFAPSNITWNNVPLVTNLRRSSYHLLHFNNPFTMVGNMNFFVEINAEPVSLTNSADLAVYLVRKNKNISFFNSDWRNDVDDVELIGTIGRDRIFHHTHVAGKSAHHLVPLTANIDGTVGTKNLDISGDFWIVLYSTSPNFNRGWNFKYHDSSICDNTNGWYRGDQFGWTTVAQPGCPDSHIHIARRGAGSDGVNAIVTANYAGLDPISLTENFYFEPLPNLPPVATNFTSPVPGGNYGTNLNISWNASSDPNDDFLTYTITLLDSDGNEIGPLISDTAGTSYVWDIGAVDNGEYGLRGEVCDDDLSPLCSTFYLSSNFFISKAVPIYSLSGISISSNNVDDSLATDGDIVELLFTSSNENLLNLNLEMYSGGQLIENAVNVSNTGNSWTALYEVSENDEEGTVTFILTADNLDLEYSETTDNSYVSVFRDETQVSEEESEEEEISEEALEQEASGKPQKAKITAWKAYRYEKLDYSCQQKFKISIRGKNFNEDAKVFVGGKEASSVVRKSSKELVAKFCLSRFFEKQTDYKRIVAVKNPDAEKAEARKQIDLKKLLLSVDGKKSGVYDFNSNTQEGIINVQTALSKLKYLDTQYITGTYGSTTNNAVKRFQRDNEIEQTGTVGPKTRAKLVEKMK